MEIPGISSFSGQPTVTNPLSQDALQQDRETQTDRNSETTNTVVVSEQKAISTINESVVNEASETQATGFNPNNPGGTIDITV